MDISDLIIFIFFLVLFMDNYWVRTRNSLLGIFTFNVGYSILCVDHLAKR